ncbi:protein sax-3 [Nematostella vectensis]|uniref:protein sax-3 n=1 Tax=Nematostella vectensis TaxID=45351 RepID=UPI0020770D95|nr:protein sax-3 [Nematostella vectensis]
MIGHYMAMKRRTSVSLVFLLLVNVCTCTKSSEGKQDLPHISHAPHVQTLGSDAQGVIRCEVSGNPPPPAPRWKRVMGNNEELITDSERYEVLIAGGLRIENVQESDAGSYICYTAARGVWVDRQITLRVLVDPSKKTKSHANPYRLALFITLGICGGIICVVAVDLACFLCNRAGVINFLCNKYSNR